MNRVEYNKFKLTGIVTDINPFELDTSETPNAWTAGTNVVFDNGETQRVNGLAPFTDAVPEEAVFALNVLTPDSSLWLYVSEDGPYAQIWVTDGKSHWNISPVQPVNADPGMNDPGEWLTTNSTAEVTGGKGVFTGSGWSVKIYQDIALTMGEDYEVHYTIDSITGEDIRGVASDSSGTIPRIEPGTYMDVIPASSSSPLACGVGVYGAGGVTAVVDNVYIYPAQGDKLTKSAGKWTGAVLNGVPVLNNGVQAPMWWDGNTSNPAQPLPDWPENTTCKAIRAFKYHLIAMNITQDSVQLPEKFMWSAAADPGTIPSSWTPEPGNDAGDNVLSATPGGINDGHKLRDTFILYKQHSAYTLDYVAGQYVFAVRPLFVTAGAQHLNCVIESRGLHYVFGDDDLYVHDGNQLQSISDKRIRNIVFDAIPPEQRSLCHVAQRVSRDEVWFMFPSAVSGKIRTAVVYSTEERAFGVRALPDVSFVATGIIPQTEEATTWDDVPEAETWNTMEGFWSDATYSLSNDGLIACGEKLYHVDAANTNDGEPVPAKIERLAWQIGQDEWITKTLRSLYINITGGVGDEVLVQLGASMHPDQPITWNPAQAIVIGEDVASRGYKVDSMIHGRYFHIRITSAGGSPWKIHSMMSCFVREGKF